MSILLRDSFRPPKGRLSYKVFREDQVIEEVDDRNLIVVGSQVTHAHLLGGDTSNRSVTLFGVGTNGTASVFANTTLTGSYVNSLGSPTYPATNEVSFPFRLRPPKRMGWQSWSSACSLPAASCTHEMSARWL